MESAKKRLMKFLNNEECKKVYDIIVKGYCRRSQNETNINNIPLYLQDIVHKYYPPFLNKNQWFIVRCILLIVITFAQNYATQLQNNEFYLE